MGIPMATSQDFVNWVCGPELNSRYLHYLLMSEQESIRRFAYGTTHQTVYYPEAKAFHVCVPGRSEQDRTVEVLGALDDKIAVTDWIVSCARELGVALYRRALNEAGGEERELSSIAEVVVRGITPRYSEASDDLMVVNQRCIRDGFISLGQARRTTGDRMRSEKLLKQYDVLVNSTGTGTLGRVGIWSSDELCTADSHVTIVRFRDDTVDPLCAGFAMLDAQPRLEAMGEGSTGQTELSRAKLSAMKIVVPSREAMSRLRPTLESLESYGQSALSESRSLAGLRDALLPKLMSGEIRVRDAEQAVERAT
jgi:type I restriction enzyme S subunit